MKGKLPIDYKHKLVVVSFKIELGILAELDKIAERKGMTRSDLLREVVLGFLVRERRKRELRLRVLRKRLMVKGG